MENCSGSVDSKEVQQTAHTGTPCFCGSCTRFDILNGMLEPPQDAVRHEVTRLLIEWDSGSREALEKITPLVYGELRKLAVSYLSRERDAPTLQPTALVHEAYLRMVDQNLPDLKNRKHFFGIAAQLMRQILIDHARQHHSQRRGGGAIKVPFDEGLSFAPERSAELLALDDGLKALAAVDERKSRIIELRFFGGLSVEETAEMLGVSIATIGREQRFAEAWLHKEISRKESPDGDKSKGGVA
jgi:RNA polymerase sigma-70 factor (ECF subfamily)